MPRASLTIPHKHCVFSVSLCIFKNPRLAVFLHSVLACFYRQFFALKNLIWRCIEVVVTRTIRNRFVLNRARGFESHHLRHRLLGGFRPQGVFLFNRAQNQSPKHLPFYSRYLYGYRYLPWLTCHCDLTNPVSSSWERLEPEAVKHNCVLDRGT